MSFDAGSDSRPAYGKDPYQKDSNFPKVCPNFFKFHSLSADKINDTLQSFRERFGEDFNLKALEDAVRQSSMYRKLSAGITDERIALMTAMQNMVHSGSLIKAYNMQLYQHDHSQTADQQYSYILERRVEDEHDKLQEKKAPESIQKDDYSAKKVSRQTTDQEKDLQKDKPDYTLDAKQKRPSIISRAREYLQKEKLYGKDVKSPAKDVGHDQMRDRYPSGKKALDPYQDVPYSKKANRESDNEPETARSTVVNNPLSRKNHLPQRPMSNDYHAKGHDVHNHDDATDRSAGKEQNPGPDDRTAHSNMGAIRRNAAPNAGYKNEKQDSAHKYEEGKVIIAGRSKEISHTQKSDLSGNNHKSDHLDDVVAKHDPVRDDEKHMADNGIKKKDNHVRDDALGNDRGHDKYDKVLSQEQYNDIKAIIAEAFSESAAVREAIARRSTDASRLIREYEINFNSDVIQLPEFKEFIADVRQSANMTFVYEKPFVFGDQSESTLIRGFIQGQEGSFRDASAIISVPTIKEPSVQYADYPRHAGGISSVDTSDPKSKNALQPYPIMGSSDVISPSNVHGSNVHGSNAHGSSAYGSSAHGSDTPVLSKPLAEGDSSRVQNNSFEDLIGKISDGKEDTAAQSKQRQKDYSGERSSEDIVPAKKKDLAEHHDEMISQNQTKYQHQTRYPEKALGKKEYVDEKRYSSDSAAQVHGLRDCSTHLSQSRDSSRNEGQSSVDAIASQMIRLPYKSPEDKYALQKSETYDKNLDKHPDYSRKGGYIAKEDYFSSTKQVSSAKKRRKAATKSIIRVGSKKKNLKTLRYSIASSIKTKRVGKTRGLGVNGKEKVFVRLNRGSDSRHRMAGRKRRPRSKAVHREQGRQGYRRRSRPKDR